MIQGRTSTGYNGPEEQNDAFMADLWQCYEDLGFADVKPPEYTPAYLAKKYGEEQQTRSCLISEGYDAPDLPSVQAYSDMFFNDGKLYSSYDFVPVNQHVADELRAVCGDPLENWGTDIDR